MNLLFAGPARPEGLHRGGGMASDVAEAAGCRHLLLPSRAIPLLSGTYVQCRVKS